MNKTLDVVIDAWAHGDPIPDEYAFCVPAEQGHIAMGPNVSPAIRWSNAPEGTRSYAIVCCDPDVPSRGDDVNQEGKVVSADLPRVDFFHWVLVDIPPSTRKLAKGADSSGITPGGKPTGRSDFGVRGINNYTDWFASDEQMKGDYGGYDGPCPPWNDELVHHYHFSVYALDVASLDLPARFGGADALQAMDTHVLASGRWTGTYTLNAKLRGD
ncbi:MAG: YbhB/YbcL family Raf kinase inhibitor-like protein [Rhodospirillales bacterium]|nr:YbhB/YbcL family Raf kinase inhibitor-like protein [Rhodospirillales bacterium]